MTDKTKADAIAFGIEDIILKNLNYNEEYTRQVIPFLKEEYFLNMGDKIYFKALRDYIEKYNTLPTSDSLIIEFKNTKGIADDLVREMSLKAKEFEAKSKIVIEQSTDWLMEKSEEFCKDKALYNALMESITISNGEDKNLSTSAIPEIMSAALAVSFDINVGHDYIADADKRYDYFHKKTAKIPFRVKILNDITEGGAERKTVPVLAAGTGVGKSAMLCDFAAGYVLSGYNVLYITNEMAEEKLAKRIDANLMNIPISDIEAIPKATWDKKIAELDIKIQKGARLKFKEYAPGTAHVGHYRFLLRELKLKQNFVPDIIIVDYMNICASSRMKNRVDMYSYVKSIAEELRAFAVENNVLLWTATQLNREGTVSSDITLANISESMGGPHTFDFLMALIVNDDLAKLGQVKVQQLKNRYSDLQRRPQFTLGYDRPKMKFYDLNNSSMSVVSSGAAQQAKQNTQSSSLMSNLKPQSKTPIKF